MNKYYNISQVCVKLILHYIHYKLKIFTLIGFHKQTVTHRAAQWCSVRW